MWTSFWSLDNSDTDQVSSSDNEEVKQHVPAQDSVSDGIQNTLNTPLNVTEDAKQTHLHLEQDICDDEPSASKDEDSLTLMGTTVEQQDENADLNKIKKENKKCPSPATWKLNESKEKCLSQGNGSSLQLKVMSVKLNLKLLSYYRQQWIFHKIWAMNTCEECWLYVTTLVTKVNIASTFFL